MNPPKDALDQIIKAIPLVIGSALTFSGMVLTLISDAIKEKRKERSDENKRHREEQSKIDSERRSIRKESIEKLQLLTISCGREDVDFLREIWKTSGEPNSAPNYEYSILIRSHKIYEMKSLTSIIQDELLDEYTNEYRQQFFNAPDAKNDEDIHKATITLMDCNFKISERLGQLLSSQP